MSSAQYPSQEWLPNNMSLHVHNAFSPFSQEFLGVYDIVHIQMFITIIEKNDPGPLIRNLMTLLSKCRHSRDPVSFPRFVDFHSFVEQLLFDVSSLIGSFLQKNLEAIYNG